MANKSNGRNKLFVLSIAALGVVYGDIGTSPLYAINKIFFGLGDIILSPANILGAISLVVWTLTIIITIKYLIFVLMADNDGEGGVFALYGLLNQRKKAKTYGLLMILLVFAAGLLFGDGLITPAISVLSAVEGLKIATPMFDNYIIIITLGILTALFLIQHKGTAKVGGVFGPIITVWFIVIAALGIKEIAGAGGILKAFNPVYGINFLRFNSWHTSLLVLGAVMLVITGGEALYADMGHFGRRPIRYSWFCLVYPALMLNYLGQGAYLLSGKEVVYGNIFYSMVPGFALYPMVILATCATVIASQALISGAFSLATQAMALRLFPRFKITHTHHEHAGQIYLRSINWFLYIGCVLLVIGFGSSNALASAYGFAVSGVMFITSLVMIGVSRFCWNWHLLKTAVVFGGLTVVDAAFLTANSLKFLEGSYIPIAIAVFLFSMMLIWKWGRTATVYAYVQQKTMTIKELIALKMREYSSNKTMIIMAPKPLVSRNDETPAAMQILWERYGVLPKNIIFVDVVAKKVPYIHGDRCRTTVFFNDEKYGSVAGVKIFFGFMEDPNVEAVLATLARHHKLKLNEDYHKWLVHVTSDRLVLGKSAGFVKRFKLGVYSVLRALSQPAYDYYGLGKEINLTIEMLPIKIG